MADIVIVKDPPSFDVVVVKDTSASDILTLGIQGPQGPAGDQVSISYPAYQDLSGHRIVRLNQGFVSYASANNIQDINFVLGMTTHAAIQGDIVNILKDGEVTEVSWNWIPNLPIYLGNDGYMTQTIPSSENKAFSMIVGIPISSNKVFIRIREPIILN